MTWQRFALLLLVAPILSFVVVGYWIGCSWALVSLLEWVTR